MELKYLTPPIPLSRRSREAWDVIGTQVPKEEVENNGLYINTGWTQLSAIPLHMWLWNPPSMTRVLSTPGRTRARLGVLLPPRPTAYPADVWMKGPGRGGNNKHRLTIIEPLVLPGSWDWQLHITGHEYRLITVNEFVVQCFERHGANGHRSYEWIRMREVPARVKELARMASANFSARSIVAWDIIDGQQGTYILEGNTCPGMSENTAIRIRRQIERILDA